MSLPVIFMFSGQGTQYYHMGREFFENNECFRESMLRIDRLIKNITGESVIRTIYNKGKKRSDFFKELSHSSLGIFMVEVSISRVFVEKGLRPDYLLGASMGEFVSAAVSKMADIEEILSVFISCMRQFDIGADHGSMIGILDSQSTFYDNPVLHRNSEISAVNFDRSYVISCKREKVNTIHRFLRDHGIGYQILPAKGAFHSSYIDEYECRVRDVTDGKISLKKPEIPLISCAHTAVTDSPVDFSFWDIIRKPIMFQKTIQRIENRGNYVYIDLGPSGTLSTFAKYNLGAGSKSKTFSVLSPLWRSLNKPDIIKNVVTVSPAREKQKHINL